MIDLQWRTQQQIQQNASAHLKDLVRMVLSDFTSHGHSFTAFDVTQAIRSQIPESKRVIWHTGGNPGCDDCVKFVFSSQIQEYLDNGTYRQTTTYPNGTNSAYTYVPMKTSAPVVSQAQNAAANAQTVGWKIDPKVNVTITNPAPPQYVNLQVPIGTMPKKPLFGVMQPVLDGSVTITVPPKTDTRKHTRTAADKGSDWKIVGRFPEQGKSTVRVQHACGHSTTIHTWAWAGRGYYKCPGCGHNVDYARSAS